MLKRLHLLIQNLLSAPSDNELLKTTQRHLLILGINLAQKLPKNPLNFHNVKSFFVFASGTILAHCSLVHLAKTFEEYIFTFCVLFTIFANFLAFLYAFWKRDEFMKFLTDIRQNMQERK